jgi:hypothetical protein
MSPDPADRRRRRSSARTTDVHVGPSADDAHEIKYFRRHIADDPAQSTPGREFLRTCDSNVRGKLRAVLVEVAAAPPTKFSGGGYWEAMHGDMTGWYEVRRDGRGRSHHRLFCLLDLAAQGQTKPWLVVITGMSKPFLTTFSAADYQSVRELGDEYLARNPRSAV